MTKHGSDSTLSDEFLAKLRDVSRAGMPHSTIDAARLRRFEQLAYLANTGQQQKASKDKFLANFHEALGQAYRSQGDYHRSFWSNLLASYYVKGQDPAKNALNTLSLANRCLRLGDAESAISLYDLISVDDVNPSIRERALLGSLKATRLSIRHEAFAERARAFMNRLDKSADGELECLWENVCLSAYRSGSIADIIKCTRRGNSHFEGHYVLEALLWSYAIMQTKNIFCLPTCTSIRRRGLPNLRGERFLLKVLANLEVLYDEDVNIHNKLRAAKQVYFFSQRLLSIDKELLALAGLIQWFRQRRLASFAEMISSLYRGKSLHLTCGLSNDVLKVF